jgi:hypothetical protein
VTLSIERRSIDHKWASKPRFPIPRSLPKSLEVLLAAGAVLKWPAFPRRKPAELHRASSARSLLTEGVNGMHASFNGVRQKPITAAALLLDEHASRAGALLLPDNTSPHSLESATANAVML